MFELLWTNNIDRSKPFFTENDPAAKGPTLTFSGGILKRTQSIVFP
ncbi:MAG TPA: hypothetical protein VHP37_03040 [Burkholderiales bacterium]|nr:hypothetical protein [Burkholderiales bacterium]